MAIPPGSLQRLYDISDPACYSGSGNTVVNTAQAAYNLQRVNGPTFVSDGQKSHFVFNRASQQYLGLGNNSTSIGGPYNTMTINVWFQSTDTSISTLFSFGYNSPSGVQPTIFLNDASAGYASASFNYGVGITFTTTPYINDTWNMITMVSDGTNNKIYLNGVLQSSAAQGGGTWPANGGSYIGALGDASGNAWSTAPFLNGKVAYLAQYDAALSAGDILTIFNNTKGRFLPTPVASYSPFDNASYSGTGNTWFDLTAYNNDLTLANQTFATSPIKSFSFANGYAYKASPASFPTNVFTFDGWFNFTGSSSQILYAGGKDGSGTGVLFGYKFPSANSNKPFFEMGGGVARLNLSLDPTPGVWYNYVITGDGTNVKAYVNGVLDVTASQSTGSINNTTYGLILGQFIDGAGGPSGTFYSPSSFGQFTVYNQALDAALILDNYNTNISNYSPSPPPSSNGVGGRQFAQGFNG